MINKDKTVIYIKEELWLTLYMHSIEKQNQDALYAASTCIWFTGITKPEALCVLSVILGLTIKNKNI